MGRGKNEGGETPVVVAGTAVASPYDHRPEGVGTAAPGTGTTRGGGEKQATRCRDPIFALLLYANVGAIVAVAAAYGSDAFSEAVDDASGGYNYNGYLYSTFILGAVAIVLTAVTLPIMMAIPAALIKCSLLMMLVLSGVSAVFMFVSGSVIGAIFGLIFFLITICYTYCVWSRIPFASVNLLTACTAIRKNAGVVFVSFVFVCIAFGWTLLWAVASAGVSNQIITSQEVEIDGVKYTQSTANYGYLFLLLLSYFFTHQVIQNTTHVTVAGTVGAWWFAPEDASSCCSAGMVGSFIRAVTTSFGSICFGSLLVALVQATKALVNSARNGDNQILVCIADCILSCIESLLEYFNKWAFVYVGLYGYSYIEAGKNVITLFKNRGWEAIIADDLVGNVFFILSLCIGGLCAAMGYGIGKNDPEGWFENSPTGGSDEAVVAGLGFLAGLVLSAILYSSIASAVNTVIVCFAEGPAEFEANHPELSRKMRETWLQFYPDCGA
ncbi:hypothetical protein ACHAW5_006092 [Stephanodiscus triporus]|uniref:Choline transporter-like protein n=1 Tax=Stephanodiscus triporus TaxID=2934178 RepID=A0ABD3MSU5_9STRA